MGLAIYREDFWGLSCLRGVIRVIAPEVRYAELLEGGEFGPIVLFCNASQSINVHLCATDDGQAWQAVSLGDEQDMLEPPNVLVPRASSLGEVATRAAAELGVLLEHLDPAQEMGVMFNNPRSPVRNRLVINARLREFVHPSDYPSLPIEAHNEWNVSGSPLPLVRRVDAVTRRQGKLG